MKVAAALDLAHRWVNEVPSGTAGFQGAFLTGSAPGMVPEDELPPCSDVDIKLVSDASPIPDTPGKFDFHGVILDVSNVSSIALADPDVVLADHQLAHAFKSPCVIADTTGELSRMQQSVASRFTQREWLLRRCNRARAAVDRWASGVDVLTDLHDQVTATSFAAGANTHLILIAALQNPTVRRRYAQCRAVLEAAGRLDLQERMLACLGSKDMSEAQVRGYLGNAAAAFDVACRVLKSPYRFAADITPATRAIAIDGSLEMIEQGYHREAMFWVLTVYSRCRAVIAADAPEALAGFDEGYRDLLTALDLNSQAQRRNRVTETKILLKQLRPAVLTLVSKHQADAAIPGSSS